jgi:hypothetical protein
MSVQRYRIVEFARQRVDRRGEVEAKSGLGLHTGSKNVESTPTRDGLGLATRE